MAVRARTQGEIGSIWPAAMNLAKKLPIEPTKLTATQKRRALKKRPTDRKPSYSSCGVSDPAEVRRDRINGPKPIR